MIRYHARWVLPVGAPAVRDGSVLVEGERIVWVGRRANAPGGAPSAIDVDLGNAILLPGLVNTHIHLDLAAFAGALDGLPFYAWVRALVRGLGDAAGAESLADASRWSVADQMAHGVTTIAHTGPGRAPLDAMRELGARGIAYLETFGPDPAQCPAAIADLRERVEGARRDETGLVRVGVSPHAPYSVSDELYRAVAGYARAELLPVAVHVAESADESRLVAHGDGAFAALLRARGVAVARRAASPIALLERTGVLATRPLCVHAIHADAGDVQRLAGAGASIAHCPRANAWFATDRAPVQAYRAAGVRLGLGTDSAAGNDAVRLLGEAGDAADDALAPAERVALATRGGAGALGLGDIVGTLAPGMQADLAAFTVGDVTACDASPERYLIECCADLPSLLTVVAGRDVARNGVAAHARPGEDDRLARHAERVRAWRARDAASGTPD